MMDLTTVGIEKDAGGQSSLSTGITSTVYGMSSVP